MIHSKFLIFDDNFIFNGIINNRMYLMGVAIIMVVVYHLFCWVYNPVSFFNLGYVGVDLFLFLSGFGLSYSFEKNSILCFYKHRIMRIYPMYFIAVLLTFFLKRWSFTDLFLNLAAIGFYTSTSENRFDWYVISLFSLYLTFPFFYYYSKLKYNGIVVFFSVVLILLYFINFQWWFDCFIGRLPIFLFGIIYKEYYKHIKKISIICILLYIPIRFVSLFLSSSLLALPIIVILLNIRSSIDSKIICLLSKIGKYTLEIYLANCIVHILINILSDSIVYRFFLYILLQTLISICFIYINKIIMNFSAK